MNASIDGSDSASWQDERRAAAKIHQDALDNARAAEAEQASAMLRDFVEKARAMGINPTRLVAHAYSGNGRYKTTLTGWYLRHDGSIACDERGNYYVLRVQSSLGARFRGVTPAPTPPPLIVGKGGRDGDAIDLKDLLHLRLTDPDSFPG